MEKAAVETGAIKQKERMGTVNLDATAIGSMIDRALAFCALKAGLQNVEPLEAMRNGDCSVCSYFMYGLAREIGAYLGDLDDSVQAVYCYEPEYSIGLDDVYRPLERGINLIVSVADTSAALTSVIASLEDGLGEARDGLVCAEANGSCLALDVKIASEADVASRRGYGALISSIHVRPLRVWARQSQ